jgi:integrase
MSEIRRLGLFDQLEGDLRWLVKLCKRLHIAASSRVTYANHHDLYLQFCGDFNVDPLAPSEDDLALAAVYFSMGHTVNSVKSYMSAVQNMFDMHGAGPLPRGPGFVLACRGLRRLLGPADSVERTRALSAAELKKILRSLNRHDADDVCFGAELTVAFWLALRTEDHVAGRLRWGDVYPQRDGSVEFILPPGKNNRDFRHVAAARRSDCLDPLIWLRRLARLMPAANLAPACPVFVSFVTVRGSQRFWPVTRGAFTTRLKSAVRVVLGLDPAFYSGYSLRRGGVTAMLGSAPVPAVKRHAGWAPNSNAVFAYFDHRGKTAMRLATKGVAIE